MKARFRMSVLAGIVLLLLFSCNQKQVVQQSESLPRSTPEAEGVDSKGIIEFLKAVDNSGMEFHSVMLVRHGKVVAEGWWSPYSPTLKHTLYSLSKSFTSTAVGFAVYEKKLNLTDKVISFFPELLPDTVSDNLREMEVKDLLTMSAGMDPDPTMTIPANYTNWVEAFLATPVVNKPGSTFLYNSMATYMLSAIVQQVTGEKIIDYLEPRLFNPLGIEGMDWEEDLRGINTGGWGLRLKTEDLAKFGQLYLQEGMWNEQQILPSGWAEEATSFKIDQAPGVPDSIKNKSDWMQGYGYQFWRCRNNAFRGDGAFGQYAIVLPDKDAVIAITCETPDMQGEINLVWEYLLQALKDDPLPPDPEAEEQLSQLLSSLALPLPRPGMESPLGQSIEGRLYQFEENDKGIESVSVTFPEGNCQFEITEKGKEYTFTLGSEGWIINRTDRPGPTLISPGKGYSPYLPPVEVAGMYRWREQDNLELTLRYIESPHTEFMNFAFTGDSVTFSTRSSFMEFYGDLLPVAAVIKGKLAT